jgi:hypothetical protein
LDIINCQAPEIGPPSQNRWRKVLEKIFFVEQSLKANAANGVLLGGFFTNLPRATCSFPVSGLGRECQLFRCVEVYNFVHFYVGANVHTPILIILIMRIYFWLF